MMPFGWEVRHDSGVWDVTSGAKRAPRRRDDRFRRWYRRSSVILWGAMILSGLMVALIAAGTWAAALRAQSAVSDDIVSRQIASDGTLSTSYVIASTPSDELAPRVAAGIDDRMLTVWERYGGGITDYDLYGSWSHPTAAVFPVVTAEQDQRGASVAGDPSGAYLFAWHDTRSGNADIYAQLLQGDSFVVTQAANDQKNPEVAYNPDDEEFLIVWQDGRHDPDNADVYAQRVSATGVLVGDAFTITTSPYRQLTPYVAYAPGEDVYLVVWRHYPGTANEYFDVYGQRVSSTGSLVGDPLTIAAGTGWTARESPTDVIYNPTAKTFLVVYQDLSTGYWNVWARPVSTSGTLGTKIQITGYRTRHEAQGVAAYSSKNDQYLVVYSYRSTPGAPRDIRARYVSGSGVVGGETLLVATGSSNQTSPDVVYLPDIDRYVVAWSEERALQQVFLPLVLR